MNIRYTNHFLAKLEDIISETDYVLRYEKGNFKSGYCILKDSKIAIINKYYTLEGKINSLIDLMKEIEINVDQLNEKNKKLYLELSQTEIKI